ncbi:bifunctional polynucleotide phosphatase/kinase [Biomphalaria glabrata]|nr:bifunctional polynucleotide phosphatase/kinase [Biomphalaria glabrata]
MPGSCQLICLQKMHAPIDLPDGVPVNIGRSPETQITDPRCSRNQVLLIADWKNQRVQVKQLGANTSAVDGNDIGHNTEVVMTPDSTLFILSGHFPHRVVFEDIHRTSPKSPEQYKTSHIKESSSKKETSKESIREKDKNHVSKPSKRSLAESSDMPEKKKTKTEDRGHVSGKSSKPEDGKRVKDSKEKVSKSSNEDDDEHQLKIIEEKLKQLKKNIQAEKKTSHNEKDKKLKPSPSLTTTAMVSSSSLLVAKENSWTTEEHLYVLTSKGVKARNKIASFDLDGTLITTSSGKVFPVDSNDWKIAYPEIFNEMKRLHQEKYKIVIFTNQLGVSKGKTSIEDLKSKIENVVTKLQVPVQAFVATHDGEFRKPCDGMWEMLKKQYNNGLPIDPKESFYVGDAAGRPANWAPKKKKDFSKSDRLFALNIGLPFKTPEEFFLHQKAAPFEMPQFDPRKLSSKDPLLSSSTQLTKGDREVIVLVGFPACGKSFFSNELLKPKGYVVVNRDTLGSWQKCVKLVNESLPRSSVVVDNTNITKDERTRYIECAKRVKLPCRCFVFTTSIEQCRHNEKFRQITDKYHEKINEMIFNRVKSKYEKPDPSEGFSEIAEVNFVPRFSSPALEAKYKKFLLEK